IRNDYPVLFIHHNNQNYGLTTGQASSTSKKGCQMNGTNDGVYLDPINPLEIVLNLNPSFVARSFSGDLSHMTEIFQKALHHDGFAFIEILQSCPTYNRSTPQEWYLKRIIDIKNLKNYDNSNLNMAQKIVKDEENKIYIGLLYQNQKNISFLKKIPNRQNLKSTLVEEVKPFDITELLKEFF
ncbi:MAG: thiamine pyrophosphate-dependent enzyme, partial [Candidatus Woesearchaeota archaeon]